MIRSLFTGAITVLISCASGIAVAEPSSTPSGSPSANVTSDDAGLFVGVTDKEASSVKPAVSAQETAANGASDQATNPTCTDAQYLVGCEPVALVCLPHEASPTGHILLVDQGYFGGNSLGWCEPDGPVEETAAQLTPGRVLQAFRRIPLPAATLDIQPPGGKTLVNLDTIFSTTTTSDLDRTLTLLGRRVQLRITPTSYTWHHGDGTTQTSDWPGRPWEEDLDMSTYLTHAYTDAHVTVQPSVDVTYTADYRIGNGPWQPVNGTVTIDGPQASLRILEARPVLTGAGRP